jgi:hypothetical protein
VLTPDLVGPSVTQNQGIIGEAVDLNLVHTGDLRRSKRPQRGCVDISSTSPLTSPMNSGRK